MEDLLMLIWTIYVNYIAQCIEWFLSERRMPGFDFSLLRKYNTRVDRMLIFLLDEYTGIPGRRIGKYKLKKKWEKNYFYYVKKIYRYIMILGIPWFITVYFMEWYLNKMFVAFHFLLIGALLLCLPGLICSFLIVFCDTKIRLYRRKERKDKKAKNQH
jgi:hypothetical protein